MDIPRGLPNMKIEPYGKNQNRRYIRIDAVDRKGGTLDDDVFCCLINLIDP